MIRPGAMTLMTVSEFLNPVHKDKNSVLIHVKGTSLFFCCMENKFYCIILVGQKASSYNDGYVNYSSKAYKACKHYLEKWRPSSQSQYMFVSPQSGHVNSSDLGILCKDIFKKVVDQKDFNFTKFRQYMQTVFMQTCTDPKEKQWFNRVMQHR